MPQRKPTVSRRDNRHLPPSVNPLAAYRVGRMAELLGTNRSTIWRWRQQGVLPEPAYKFGKTPAWSGQQLLDLQRQDG